MKKHHKYLMGFILALIAAFVLTGCNSDAEQHQEKTWK